MLDQKLDPSRKNFTKPSIISDQACTKFNRKSSSKPGSKPKSQQINQSVRYGTNCLDYQVTRHVTIKTTVFNTPIYLTLITCNLRRVGISLQQLQSCMHKHIFLFDIFQFQNFHSTFHCKIRNICALISFS